MAAKETITNHGMQITPRQKIEELQTKVSLEEKLNLFYPQ